MVARPANYGIPFFAREWTRPPLGESMLAQEWTRRTDSMLACCHRGWRTARDRQRDKMKIMPSLQAMPCIGCGEANWLSARFAARFSTSSCGFATCFRLFLSKTWSRTCCINLDVRSSLGFKQVCSWLSTCFRYAFDLLATCFRHARSRKSKARFAARFAAC